MANNSGFIMSTPWSIWPERRAFLCMLSQNIAIALQSRDGSETRQTHRFAQNSSRSLIMYVVTIQVANPASKTFSHHTAILKRWSLRSAVYRNLGSVFTGSSDVALLSLKIVIFLTYPCWLRLLYFSCPRALTGKKCEGSPIVASKRCNGTADEVSPKMKYCTRCTS